MFIQVIQGGVTDGAGLRRQFDRWRDELAPKAEGWLGTTAGLPTRGGFIAVVRFESEEAARRNSELPAQDQWWADTAQYLADDVVFHDCSNIDLILGGGDDHAGFVQVIQARTDDPERLREIGEQLETPMRAVRPDIVGGSVAWHPDGTSFTQTVYFTSEAEARAAEQQEPPADVRGLFEQSQRLVVDPRYFDLPDPWLSSR
jgi:hypothetical protein